VICLIFIQFIHIEVLMENMCTFTIINMLLSINVIKLIYIYIYICFLGVCYIKRGIFQKSLPS
jgi:hypothetical protein